MPEPAKINCAGRFGGICRDATCKKLHPAAAAVRAIGDARFFQVQFVFDAPARFVGDLAVAQQLVDELALGVDQFVLDVGRVAACGRDRPVRFVRQNLRAALIARAQMLDRPRPAVRVPRSPSPAASPLPSARPGARASSALISSACSSRASRVRPSQRTTHGSIRPCPTKRDDDDAEGDEQDQVAVRKRLRRSRPRRGSPARPRAKRRRECR